MKRIDLNGEWEVCAVDTYATLPAHAQRTLAWMSAVVPGTIHTDLLRHGIIPDPYYRMNENEVQWVENVQWKYRRTFDVDASILKERWIVLVADGLDTYAAILLNGKKIGSADNMFVHHRFDIKRYVKAGNNTIEILFDSPVARSKALERKHGKLQVALESHRVYVRKAQYSFSWDWGPKLTTSGIWKAISIEAWSGPILRNPVVRTVGLKKKSATIELSVEIENCTAPMQVTAKIEGEYFSSEIVKRATSSTLRFRMVIDHPNIWWPNGYGAQPLYSATLSAVDHKGNSTTVKTTFGIRTVELLQEKDKEGKSFVIVVNGEKIFCKGADWIPSDNFLPRIPDSTYERLLTMARDANMNMIRVWGGGIYEQDRFYDLCDRLGLLVWQDFMFACGEYPQTAWFLNSVRDEAAQAVIRLRNHPSLALWCGNNECEWLFCTENPEKTADDMIGAVIFKRLLPDVVGKYDGTRPYWRSSPFGSGFPNGESDGNHHQWQVWSFWKDFHEYEKTNARFVTEFGFQAPATLPTWVECTEPGDRHPQHRVIEHHNKQVEGQERLFRFQAAHYVVGRDFSDFVYRGQLVQANALKSAVEHWRRRKFNTAGALFWQLNDCWPVSSWAVIDSALRPKAAYYYAKRFFAPVLVSLKRKEGKVEVWGINDTVNPVQCTLSAGVKSFSGEYMNGHEKDLLLKPNSSRLIAEIPISIGRELGKEDSYVVARFMQDDTAISENRLFFDEPKHLLFPPPEISSSVRMTGSNTAQVTLRAGKFAKDVCLSFEGVDAEPDDNFFDIDAGESKTVMCRIPELRSDLATRLQIISLH